ncbi:hypothetical protein PAHAL_1G152700 [Panicum hallii]|uniref:Uncharacterized protein n=1 Tax=Panicum hallii TaxID=206008 RepID=A0A2T8KVA5_9POAL|nr:hypothetical protein PAHAL_1G152700 [Panicum hallii]
MKQLGSTCHALSQSPPPSFFLLLSFLSRKEGMIPWELTPRVRSTPHRWSVQHECVGTPTTR